MRILRFIRWAIIVSAIIVGASLSYYNFILDWHNAPYCHKQIMLSFLLWMDGHKTDVFPNVKGVSHDSLSTINEAMNSTNWATNYMYVPGLRKDDPGDLVLMYVARPTRWTWHGSVPTIFRKKAWIIVPVDFKLGNLRKAGPGEDSERVSAIEFQQRLKRTLDFIRTNDRPNWQTVVSEHARFLSSP